MEVEFENPRDVFELRDHLSEVCRYRLLPAIEKVFDERSVDDAVISISSLHIDAGTLPPDDWERVFVEAVTEQLSDYLRRAIPRQNEAGIPVPGGFSPDKAGNRADISGKPIAVASLLYYLRTG
ncbi:MAG TPA: contractile injection system tape measure protein, partial [Anseongella sp.]|nr:contractile injection system tape measure protein [Anseongella sp.]